MPDLKRFWAALLLALAVISGSAFAQEPIRFQVGDIILLQLPGEPAFDQPFSVDRRGRLILPEVGAIHVEGKTRAEALEILRTRLSEVYRDLSRLELILKDRRLEVTVLGYVEKPGPVDLPGDATIQQALQEAGGLRPGAQLDRMQLRRDGKIVNFDYKGYLDSGDESRVPRLRSLDTIFVPASPLTGKVHVKFDAQTLTAAGDAGEDEAGITVFGEVHRPGSFAYKKNNNAVDWLMRAGGVTRYAGVEQIRVVSKGKPFPFNLREYLDTGDTAKLPPVSPGDLIFVPQASEQVQVGARTVYIMGEVKKPGAYETKDEADFFDILANAGGPTRFAETRQIRILKRNGEVIPYDLQAYTEGISEQPLPSIRPGDAILIPERTDLNEKSWLKVAPSRAVMVIGAMRRPGRYEWSAEMSLLDLIAHAGGPISTADTAHLNILDFDPVTGKTTPTEFNLKRFLEEGGDFNELPEISAGDTIDMPELPRDPSDNRSQWIRQSADRSIYVFGQVRAPGRYAFNEKMSFLDIMAQAQGPTVDADLSAIRITHRHEGQARVTRLNLAHYFETGDDTILPRIRIEDVIYIPSRNRAYLEKPKEETIRVLGSVRQPGRYAFNDNMTLLDLLAEAGGPLPTALIEKIVVVNKTVGMEPHARTFDLLGFAKTGDYSMLPVIRSGDTVFVPSAEQSGWAIWSKMIRETVNFLSLLKLIEGL